MLCSLIANYNFSTLARGMPTDRLQCLLKLDLEWLHVWPCPLICRRV